MMSKGHNKKRNVGLLYEFLVRHISTCLVENNAKESDRTLKILKKFFRPGTELYREFRLFNSLLRTTVRSENVASSIISEAKSLSRKFDRPRLAKEKSLLIREINHGFGSEFFKQRISDYRMYATIQTLMSDWRDTGNPDLARIARYEDIVVEWIMSNKETKTLEEHRDPDIDSLVVKIMTDKINKKYGESLNEEQRAILRAYSLGSSEESDSDRLASTLAKIRDNTVSEIQRYRSLMLDEAADGKLRTAEELIKDLDLSSVDDRMITRFLEISQLKQELTGE